MPAFLFFLAALAGVALLAYRASSSDDDAPAGGGGGELVNIGPDLAQLEPVGAAATVDASAGAELLELHDILPGAELKTAWSAPARAAPYLDAINAAEQKHGLPSGLLLRQLYQESAYRPDIITGRLKSSAGAVGIAQFLPATAADMGVDPLDPTSSIDGAARYMRSLFNALGTWPAALAGYNWGIGNVRRKGIAAAPAETRKYVASIVADVPTIG